MEEVVKNAAAYDARAEEWEKAMEVNVGHKYLEKPAMMALLPESFEGKTVLCIGVGSGEEIAEIARRNPAKIIGIDISERLLESAARKFPQVEFKRMDMAQLSFPDQSFDFLYSSLALHYAADWDKLFRDFHRVLKKGGVLLFSSHNPERWGKKPRTGKDFTTERGEVVTQHTDDIQGGIEIVFYNQPDTESVKRTIENAGFHIDTFSKPDVVEVEGLSDTVCASYEALKAKNQQNPLFIVVRAHT